MRIYNAKVFVDGAFIEGGVEFTDKFTAVGAHITEGDVDAQGMYLIPGLVDVHTHGAMGEDASDGNAAGMYDMGRYYAKEGVTSWCPTTMTLPEDVLTDAVKAIASYERPVDGAKAVGIHLEGPFLCYEKRGAQAAEHLHKPDAAMFHRLNEASGNLVKLVTVAPEEEGAMEFIADVSKTCTVSLGHTVAEYDTAMAAYKAGASHATHLFNGMPSLHHRKPSVIGAAFDAGATVELITDGIHIDPAVIRMVYRLYGENMVLVSDSLRCAGLPDGDYTLGGQPITMTNGKATLSGTDTIAGSSIHLMEGLRRTVGFGLRLEQAVTAATLSPARAIRMEDTIGSIAVGKCADLVLLDAELNVKDVYIDGKSINE